MVTFLLLVYGVLAMIAAGNLLLMKSPSGSAPVNFEVMIPARNEADNLPNVVAPLVQQGVRVTVFDDESTDGTGDIARSLGASVITPSEPLPSGWTGKNRACHQLSQSATAEWVVFLDADTFPQANFAESLSEALNETKSPVISAFLGMRPGKGLEPAYLGWVPWILLATNPFGLVSRSGTGHNRFTNGQFTAWRLNTLQEIKPFEQVRNEILEDVKIGRLLASKRIPVEVINLSKLLKVQMYADLPSAIRGMCKNSADIAGSTLGSIILILVLLAIAWSWLWGGIWCLALLILSKILTDRVTRFAPWTALFIPITITGAALTIVASMLQKRSGTRTWKGRTYS